MNKNSIKQRNSSVELLRIISMLFIVISHYSVHGVAVASELPFSINRLLISCTDFGKIGVAIFIMITGYYMSTTKFKIDRTINIMLQTLFYSILLFVIFCVIDRSNFSIKNLVYSFFPVITKQYWFVTAYVILTLLMPFINKLISYMSRKELLKLVLVMILFFSIAPTILQFDALEFGGRLGYIIMYYIIGAYIRLYPKNVLSKEKNSLLVLVASFVLLLVAAVGLEYLSTKFAIFADRLWMIYGAFSVLIVLIATSALSIFANIKPFYNKIINVVGSCTFGVYLIHDNVFVRQFLWNNAFDNSKYSQSSYLILHYIVSVLIVFCGCTLVEYLRKNCFERFIFSKTINCINKLANKVLSSIDRKINDIVC